MKKVLYVIKSLPQKRVFESLQERDDMRQAFLGPYPEITKIINGVNISEDYSDFNFKNIMFYNTNGEMAQLIAKFNPDVFLKVGRDILVLELKMDDDASDENKAKLKYAKEHFDKVNELQKKQNYCFKFLSPQDYDAFFDSLRNKTYQKFISSLEADLEE